MEAVRAALICASAALICSFIPRSEMRLGVVIAAGLCVIALCLQPLREGAAMLKTLGAQSGADTGGVMIRAVGVAIVAEFGAQLCRDAGEGALAGRVELAGRVTMLGLAMPLITELVARLGAMMP